MDDVADIGLLQPRHQGRLAGVGTIGRKDVTPSNDDFEQAHFTVLQNMTCIEPYIHEHMSYLAENNSRRDQRWLEAKHERTFSQWLADKVICMSPTNVDADVIHLGYRPRRVLQYQGYEINGYTFYTKQQDEKSIVQNSGVTLIATMTDSSRMTVAKIRIMSKWSIVGIDDVVDEDEYNQFDELPPFSIGVQYTDDDPPEPRTRRGINIIQDLPDGESVEFNKFGQAVGKWQYLYGKYIGTHTRRLISILKKNWKQVTKEEKIFLWSNIKVQATKDLAQGSNESKARVDPLILVLGPEHGGRTRGVGYDVGYKKGIEGYVRKKRTYEQRKDIEEIRNEVRQEMKEELKSSEFGEEMRAELKAELWNEKQAE
ncbi:hypothetical protein Tco_1456948 [Tanacetum coccineum]